MKRFQPLADAVVRELQLRDAIFDGEIVVMRDQLPDSFALMFRRGEPEYAAFDLLFLNGKDLRGLSYERRKTKLKKLLANQSAVGYVEARAEPELFEVAVRLDLEGCIAKRRTDPFGQVHAINTAWRNGVTEY
jgi:bifunctional non-homologous end joining protein LigD